MTRPCSAARSGWDSDEHPQCSSLTTGHQRTGEPQEGLWIASHLSSVMAIAEVFLGVSFDPGSTPLARTLSSKLIPS